MSIENNLILKAAKGEPVERTPVWLMRQAGRILPEYRKVRASVSGFKELVKTPELACEVTLQPVDILGVDAAIIFSDILVIPEAMGLPYELIEKTGPVFEKTIASQADVDKLQIAQAEDLLYVTQAIKLTKKELNNRVPLIGFAGAPWTVLSYMIEGKGSKTFSMARKFLYAESNAAHNLLQKITDSTMNYLKAQIAAGADIVQIFDSWAGILSHDQYQEFGLPYIAQICEGLDGSAPIIVFAKGANSSLKELAATKCDVLSLDWTVNAASAKADVNGKALQGNLDPALLYSNPDTIRSKTTEMLKEFGPTGHIANLGHGVYPDTPLDNVKCFVDTVKEYRFE